MKIADFKFIFLAILVGIMGCGEKSGTDGLERKIDDAFKTAYEQYVDMLEQLNGKLLYPRSIEKDGNTKLVNRRDWTSGFFPGSLWYLYEATKDESIKNSAIRYTEGLQQQKYDSTTHDTGFQMYCSYGNGYRLTGKKEYADILHKTSTTLSSRFAETVGCIRSWDFGDWMFPVIIDNMMNLELLYWTGPAYNNKRFTEIANLHATNTMQNHYREDFSSCHVVDYNPGTGEVIERSTWQGLHDSSSWARGQAWGLYGFTMAYRESGKSEFLHHARHVADYIINELPDDYVPYWDFSLENIENEPRDASAAAIIASALLELAGFAVDKNEEYTRIAENILLELTSKKYLAKPGENNFFILKHSTGHKGFDSEVDVPLNYADYYFLEAMLRYKALKEKGI